MYFDNEGKPRNLFGISARGILMGIAEVVPGVSGGTVAFVTGIYRELLTSLAAFGRSSMPLLAHPGKFAAHHNLRFLLPLAFGMGLGIFAFANVMDLLMTFFRPAVWAFFAGVIAMSVVVIGRFRHPGMLLCWGAVGFCAGLAMLWLPTPTGEAAAVTLFIGAMLAVCAWLLPAISGSYILLSLGLYHQVIRAVTNLDWSIIAIFAAGCVTGVLIGARSLSWLLRRHTEPVLCILTGVMVGSIPRLWPWQDDTESQILARLLSPEEYRDVIGEPYQVVTFFLFVAGAWALLLLSSSPRLEPTAQTANPSR